jgi:Xaa-Pro aminopeptidase
VTAVQVDHGVRRGRLAALLAERDLDAALVTGLRNVRYLTGLDSSNAALLVTTVGEAVLATDSRYAEAAVASCPGVTVRVERQVASSLVGEAATRVTGHPRLAVERHVVTAREWDRLVEVAGTDVELLDLDEAVEGLRSEKEPGEAVLVAAACALADEALLAVLAAGLAGRDEASIARDLESRMLALGAEAVGFESIVASGPHGAVPHHHPGERVVQSGDLVTIDFGARVAGYHSDCTRTVSVGEPADWQREVYAVVAAAQQAGLDALHPGASTAAVDSAARQVVADGGYGEFFTHGLGHGVGLDIHEPPWLAGAAGEADRLPARSTLTVEPGIYLPGRGGVRIEDTVDVGADEDGAGVRVLTTTTKALLTVD